MVWFDAVEQMFMLLTVRAVESGRFELLRVSERGAAVLRRFNCAEDAIRCWNAAEDALRQRRQVIEPDTEQDSSPHVFASIQMKRRVS